MEKRITTIELNTGFVEPVIKPEDYITGTERSIEVTLGQVEPILRSNGQWDDIQLPQESQQRNFDTFGCTVFNSTNQLEIQDRVVNNKQSNYSDRFLYNLIEIVPPGADPNLVYEAIRTKGLVSEEDYGWGMDIDSLEKYATPRPLPQYILDTAKEWLKTNILKHEYLPRGFDGL